MEQYKGNKILPQNALSQGMWSKASLSNCWSLFKSPVQIGHNKVQSFGTVSLHISPWQNPTVL